MVPLTCEVPINMVEKEFAGLNINNELKSRKWLPRCFRRDPLWPFRGSRETPVVIQRVPGNSCGLSGGSRKPRWPSMGTPVATWGVPGNLQQWFFGCSIIDELHGMMQSPCNKVLLLAPFIIFLDCSWFCPLGQLMIMIFVLSRSTIHTSL